MCRHVEVVPVLWLVSVESDLLDLLLVRGLCSLSRFRVGEVGVAGNASTAPRSRASGPRDSVGTVALIGSVRHRHADAPVDTRSASESTVLGLLLLWKRNGDCHVSNLGPVFALVAVLEAEALLELCRFLKSEPDVVPPESLPRPGGRTGSRGRVTHPGPLRVTVHIHDVLVVVHSREAVIALRHKLRPGVPVGSLVAAVNKTRSEHSEGLCPSSL
mmetsp:Transcript_31491/g.62219  ORF Transcript_31491/g.62219 Transcript_31491/m.62219 type:complete len:216 (-) Transcript_31491:1654-2301(-)